MLTKQSLGIAAVWCVALLVAYAPAAVAQQSTAVSEGAKVYGATCGRCHNPRSPLERSDRDWVTIINHMRVRANLTGNQTSDVLAFLQATNSDPRESRAIAGQPPAAEAPAVSEAPPSSDAAMVAEGESLVSRNACLGCHVVGGTGGQLGPSLDGVVDKKGPAYVRQKLADPTFDLATSMMPNFGLTSEQVEAVLAYLATLGGE